MSRVKWWMALAGAAVGVSLLGCGEAPETETASSGAVETPAVVEEAPAEPASLVRFGATTPPAKADGTIRLATYNLENLFDDQDDPALSGDFDDADETKPEGEVAAAAEAIRELDADILALQEVESEAALVWFRDTYLQGLGYEHIASVDVGDARGIECGVLSRFPVRDAEVWIGEDLGMTHPDDASDSRVEPGDPVVFRRSPMRVVVDVPAADGTVPLVVYSVHHKSGWRNAYWRIAEAYRIGEKVTKEIGDGGDALVAVMGDFNARLTDQGPGEVYLAGGLVDSRASAGGDLEGSKGVTHESGRAIDHIFVSPALAERLVSGSVFVLGTNARPENDDWRNTPKPEGYASDHYPVSVDVRVE